MTQESKLVSQLYKDLDCMHPDLALTSAEVVIFPNQRLVDIACRVIFPTVYEECRCRRLVGVTISTNVTQGRPRRLKSPLTVSA
jgi:hypothetical protein